MKKWSDKTEKSTIDSDDEFMILDSADPNAATKNKRVKLSTAFGESPGLLTFQTVGAVTATKVYTFNTAVSARFYVAASNAGNTKGLTSIIDVMQTVTNASQNGNTVTDFLGASATVNNVPGTITLMLAGDAGETINWIVSASVITI